jgi:hypothetical protein
LSARFRFTPSRDIRLIRDEGSSISHSRVYSIHDEPAFAACDLGGIDGANIPFGVDHTKDKKTPNGR